MKHTQSACEALLSRPSHAAQHVSYAPSVGVGLRSWSVLSDFVKILSDKPPDLSWLVSSLPGSGPVVLCHCARLTETEMVNEKYVQLALNKECFLLFLPLGAEDVCVCIKTLSPAIWMPLICLSSVVSWMISVVSMSTDDRVVCGAV